MPGRYCSSARRRADRGSPPHGAVWSRTKRVAPAHRRFLSPWRVRRTGRQPHIPAVLPRTRAGRSPRHEPRSGASAGLSRVAPHTTGGPPSRAPAALLGLRRARTIHVHHVPGLCPGDSRRPSPERLRDHRDPSSTMPIFFWLSTLVARRDAVRRPGTDQTRPSPSGLPSGLSTASGRSHQLVADPENPSPPVPRAVHRVTHRGALFCGNRRQAPTRLSSHGQVRHSYTACGWSCPQSSTGLLWVFTSAECRRRRWTTGSRAARQILTTSWFSPRNLWTAASYTPCGRLTRRGSVHSSVDSCGRRPSQCGRATLDQWTTCGDRSAAHRRRDFPTLGPPVRPHAFVPSDLGGHRFSTRSTTPMTTTKVFSEGKFHTPSSGSGGRRCDLCSTSPLPILAEPW